MRFGISSTIVKDRNILELINSMKDYDFPYLEIRCEKDHIKYEDKNELKNLKSILKRYNIEPLSIHPPDWIDLGSENEHIRIKSIREVQKCVLVAHHLNALRVIVHPANSESNIDIIIKSIEEVKMFANDWGKEILIENTLGPKSSSNLQELNSISQILNLKICFDTSHYFANNTDYDEIKIIEDRISEIHISDSLIQGEDDHLFPGYGKIDWIKFFNTIDMKNIDIIVELMPSHDVNNLLTKIKELKKRIQNGNFS